MFVTQRTKPPRVGGIFVGGRGTRMGGVAKGLLRAPDGGTLVDRWVRLFRALGLEPCLVGEHEAYAAVALERVPDATGGVGPLGGLVALLERAEGPVIAVACDMPFVSAALLERLVTTPSRAPILAPRREGRWEPLFARYDARALPLARAQLERGRGALFALLDAAGAEELPMGAAELAQLEDWDE